MMGKKFGAKTPRCPFHAGYSMLWSMGTDCWGGAVCFHQPVSHYDLGFSCKSHCLSSCFCFLLCVCLCLTFSSVLSGILSPQPLFLLLKYLLLSQSWISACTVSLKVSPWIMCMHWAWLWFWYHLPAQCADINTLKLLLLLLSHDTLTVNKVL